jgi:hypothetical protein
VDEIGFQTEYGRRSAPLADTTDAKAAGEGRAAAPAAH